MHAQDTSELFFTDVRVPTANLLGDEGGGFVALMQNLPRERVTIGVTALATAEKAFEDTLAYCKQRQAFGQPIGKFQSVAGKLADMYVRLEAAKLLIYRVAWLKQQGRSAPAEAAAAKLFTSEAFVQSSRDAIQAHGALGYMKEAGIERDLRDALASTIYSGTSEIQRVVLARMLGL
jgi:alkylation response protein AidB-like acyl-CoA dehydrogenase